MLVGVAHPFTIKIFKEEIWRNHNIVHPLSLLLHETTCAREYGGYFGSSLVEIVLQETALEGRL